MIRPDSFAEVIGTQPLLVLRPTGPITLLLEKLHEASATRKTPRSSRCGSRAHVEGR